MPKISVIIPVFNVETYLYICLESVIAQTFKEIEIILIDDASTDSSYRIMQEFQMRDSRIILLRNSNKKGPGHSRNKAIKKARGEYLAFVDSDDFISSDLLEKTYALAQKEKSDMVKFRFRRVQDDGSPTSVVSPIYYENIQKAIFKEILSVKYISVIWDGIYKRTLFIDNNLFFDNMYYEDVAFCFKLFYYAKKISFSNEIFYSWRERKGSITRSINKKQIDDIFKSLDITHDFLFEQNCYEVYEKEFIERCVIRYNILVSKIKDFSSSHAKTIKKHFIYVENKINQSIYFSKTNLDLLKSYKPFLFMRYKQDRLTAESYLLQKQDFQTVFYNLNIKLLREQSKTSNYINQLQKQMKVCNKITTLKNKFYKKRCVIVGLETSLYSLNPSILQKEYTFCFNDFFTKLNDFKPTFYVGDNSDFIEKNTSIINKLDIPYKFIPSHSSHHLKNKDLVYAFNENLDYDGILSPNYQQTNFSFEAEKQLYKAATTAHLCMQLAYYLGFGTVYLIGIDLIYDNSVLTINSDTTIEGITKVLEDFNYVKTIFENDGRKIYNLSYKSALDMFETIDSKILE